MPPTNLSTTIKKVIWFALPLSTSALINMISSFAAMFMVAKLGKEELAAGALAVSTYITITMMLTIFYAIGILISHYRGEQKSPVEIGEVVRNGVWLAILFAIPTSILLGYIDHLLVWLGQNPELVKLTKGYFYHARFLMFPLLIGMVVAQFFTATGFPRYNFIIALVCLPATIFLSYCLILGKFGFQKHGLAGVTYANLITQTVVCIVVMFYIIFGKNPKKYKIFSGNMWPNWILCKQIITLGLPIGVQFGGELMAMTFGTYLMGRFGVIALAASQVTSQYFMLIIMMILGLSQALSMLISEARAKKEYHQIRQYMHSGIIILVSIMVCVFVVFLFAPIYLTQFFLNKNDFQNMALIHLTISFFAIAGFTLLADGVRNILSGCLRGMNDSRAPMTIGILCVWFVSLPMSYLVAFVLHGGPIGLRLGFLSGFVIAAIWLWLRIMKKIELLQRIEALACE